MIIIVNSVATRSSGALTIYKQFISHLKSNINGNSYYIFVDSSMPQPEIEGVTYICDDDHSWRHRIYWDYFGCTKWLKRNAIKADVIVSLQNSGIVTCCKQIIYYHQSIPFYKKKWNILKKNERVMAMYKYIYPLIIAPTFNINTHIVVQIPFVKKGFIKRFNLDKEKVHVLFPDVESINIEKIKTRTLDANNYHFVYPATYNPYKEHRTIIEAFSVLKKDNSEILKNIKVHFTLLPKEAPSLVKLANTKGVMDNIIFEGRMPYEELLSLYKASDALFFPSIIETLGLPLIEAAKFGMPIIATDLDYAREVLGSYGGVTFVKPQMYRQWATAIEYICHHLQKNSPIENRESSWPQFFELIEQNQISK